MNVFHQERNTEEEDDTGAMISMGENEKSSDLIRRALANGLPALGEFDSKQLLSSYGIPVTRETIAEGPDSAVTEAVKLGFPIVLKASGRSLFHKTEVEGVALNLRNESDVRQAAEELLSIQGCEALLVQEMVKGSREWVCGLKRDDQFKVCVMFGLGGVFTEVLDDVTFRIAPITLWDAEEMMTEVRCRKLLQPFRGQPAVNRRAVAQALVDIARIGLQHENIVEIDINPLKIREDGNPVAVDALIVLKPPQTR
jgi:acyl-CoA synthetase (NDP forming)